MDPESHEVVARVAVGEGPLAASEGFGSVWVTSSADGTVTVIDPGDNSVLDTIEVGPVPFQLAAAGGGMWVAMQDAAVGPISTATGSYCGCPIRSRREPRPPAPPAWVWTPTSTASGSAPRRYGAPLATR